MKDIPEVDRQELRKFGYILGGFIGVVFGLVFPYLFHATPVAWPSWPWVLCAGFIAWASLAPGSLCPVYRMWMRFGLVMNAIVSPLLLGIVFFLVVLPTGLIIRLRGRDPMRRAFRTDMSKSYRVESQKAPPKQMEKPF